MTTWAATTDQVIDNGFGGSREGSPINGAIPHHAAGTNALGYVANANSRNSHPTYHIDQMGKVSGIVHPDRQPYSTANAVDNQAITFEMDNMVAAEPWPIADATIEALIEVILDHYRQSPRFGKGFAKNIPGVTQEQFFIGWHSQYTSTGCPGKYFLDRIDWLVGELNRRASGGTPILEEMEYDVSVIKNRRTGRTYTIAPGYLKHHADDAQASDALLVARQKEVIELDDFQLQRTLWTYGLEEFTVRAPVDKWADVTDGPSGKIFLASWNSGATVSMSQADIDKIVAALSAIPGAPANVYDEVVRAMLSLKIVAIP